MLFNSIRFLIFFPIISIAYFLIPHRFRWLWLLGANYYFYMCWNPKYALILISVTAVTYLSGLLIHKADSIKDNTSSIRVKKLCVFMSFAINVTMLAAFKYINFFDRSINHLMVSLGINSQLPQFDIIMPIGISFYTLQALSYTMDVYRGDVEAEKNLGKYAVFVSFFPQLVSGPIEKSKNFLKQLDEHHSFDYYRIKNGTLLMIWGFFMKLVVADRLGVLVDTVYKSPESYKGFQVIIASVFYSFQIYCDFCAYSDIARGAAAVMGFNITKNFQMPYFSASVREFWKRWHVSLTSWFRDYLYIPLGGNRKGTIRKYINIMIVFLVSGLWHGANFTFIIWGGLHGAYQIIGDILKPAKRMLLKALHISEDNAVLSFMRILTTFFLVNFAWIFFRAATYKDALTLIKNMFCFNPQIFSSSSLYSPGLSSKDFFAAILSIITVIAVNYVQRKDDITFKFSSQNIILRWVTYIAVIMAILTFGSYSSYNPQQFIYLQF